MAFGLGARWLKEGLAIDQMTEIAQIFISQKAQDTLSKLYLLPNSLKSTFQFNNLLIHPVSALLVPSIGGPGMALLGLTSNSSQSISFLFILLTPCT